MSPATPDPADNPLFDYERPPRFDRIRSDQVAPAIRTLIPRQNATLDALEKSATPTWDGLMEPLSRLGEPLNYAWGVTHHLLSVKNSPELRTAQESVQAEVVTAAMRLGQSEPIYRGMKQLQGGAEWSRLDQAQRRIVEAGIRAAEHAGIGLQGVARERFNAIEQELAEVTTKFSNHLLDATKAFALELRDRAEVDGLPPSLLAAAAQAARSAGAADADAERGPWRITLETPMYVPFMEHSRRRDLRERMYRAYIGRAASGEYDNQPLVDRILRLRREQARLLGFASFAELSLSRKMAERVPAVEKLLDELRAAALPKARQDFAELRAFAREESARAESRDPALELRHWDVAFWAERLRERRYAFNDEELRPYFPLPRVLDGLFAIAKRLFGVVVTPADGEVPVWHPEVRYFHIERERIADGEGRALASFYLDPYSRPADKRGGAWMNNCLDRKRGPAGLRLPVAYLVCNQPPPVGDKPSLMTFRDVETLFHEFGHGLQHMLTTVDHPDAAGINNVEWDAVELPSQFMENWCYHRDTLLGLARHYQTGAPLPEELFRKIIAARTYRAASVTLRQVYFSTIGLELHQRFDPDGGESVLDANRRIAAAGNTVLPPLPEDRFLCSFSHIFAGGYAAGYYSYKWAEVLSADAFAAFEEAGLDDAAAVASTGRRFRDTVLALGGSRHPMEVFKAFRGRPPTTAALLRHYGLTAS